MKRHPGPVLDPCDQSTCSTWHGRNATRVKLACEARRVYGRVYLAGRGRPRGPAPVSRNARGVGTTIGGLRRARQLLKARYRETQDSRFEFQETRLPDLVVAAYSGQHCPDASAGTLDRAWGTDIPVLLEQGVCVRAELVHAIRQVPLASAEVAAHLPIGSEVITEGQGSHVPGGYAPVVRAAPGILLIETEISVGHD